MFISGSLSNHDASRSVFPNQDPPHYVYLPSTLPRELQNLLDSGADHQKTYRFQQRDSTLTFATFFLAPSASIFSGACIDHSPAIMTHAVRIKGLGISPAFFYEGGWFYGPEWQKSKSKTVWL